MGSGRTTPSTLRGEPSQPAKRRSRARPFVVPLPGTALAHPRAAPREAGKSPWVLASPKDPEKHIGEKVLVRALSRLQDGKRLALGEKLTVHDLRRTWRSLAMDLGIDHAVARLSLGHAGLEGVEGLYGRSSQMLDQRAPGRRPRCRGPRPDPAWRTRAGCSAERTKGVEGAARSTTGATRSDHPGRDAHLTTSRGGCERAAVPFRASVIEGAPSTRGR